jgi:hypothetical protein
MPGMKVRPLFLKCQKQIIQKKTDYKKNRLYKRKQIIQKKTDYTKENRLYKRKQIIKKK